jgi:hypothetical protein
MEREWNMKKFVSILVMTILLQAIIVSTIYAAPEAGGSAPGGYMPGGGDCGGYHTVQYGETLYSIGRMYGVNPHQLAEANGLYNPDHIYAGQQLHIPCSQGHDYPHHDGGYQPPPSYQYPAVGYGYDYTGYYYETYYPNYSRYSYTCGYHYNCY